MKKKMTNIPKAKVEAKFFDETFKLITIAYAAFILIVTSLALFI